MTVEAISSRIDEIQQMISSLQAGPAGGADADFAQALQTATQGGTQNALSDPATSPTSAIAPMAATGGATGGLTTPFAGEIQAAATKHGVDPALLAGLVRQESNFNPNAKSPAGASGLTQLMPGTAASLGVTDPTDPAQALDGGAKYLKQQLDAFGGDERKALAAYNAGPGAVQRFGGIPPYAETQNYVTKVLGYAQEYRAGAQAAGAVSAATTTLPITAAALGGTATDAAAVPTTSMSTPTSSSPAGGLPYTIT